MANTGGTCEGVPMTTGGIAGFAAAMLGALWAYDGWNNITFLAGEVKNPGRNLPLALIGGRLVVMGLYLFVNLSYFHVLTPTEIASVPASSSVAAEVVRRLLGAFAVTLMAAAMMTSSFGALHASILATARIPYALANDGLVFKSLAEVSPRTHVPVKIARRPGVLGMCDCALRFVRHADRLCDLRADSVLRTRRRIDLHLPQTHARRRAHVSRWGYPYVPIIFLVVSVWLIFADDLAATRVNRGSGWG